MNYIFCCIYMMFKERNFSSATCRKVRHILNEVNSSDILKGRKFAFSVWFWPFDLAASAIMSHRILFSFEWCHRLFHADKDVRDAFRFALGHEAAHKKGFYYHETKGLGDMSFLQWTMEEFCDFESAKNTCESREQAVNGIEYMIREKPNNKDGLRYPGWTTRRDYIKNCEFNEEFLRNTAKKTGCENEELIECVINHYSGF